MKTEFQMWLRIVLLGVVVLGVGAIAYWSEQDSGWFTAGFVVAMVFANRTANEMIRSELAKDGES